MVRAFSPRDTLRHLPAPLVAAYLEADHLTVPPDWATLPDDPDSLVGAWEALPPDARNRVEAMLRAVHELSDPAAARTLAEEATFQGYDLGPPVPGHGRQAAALRYLIECPTVFHHVHRFRQADRLPGRYWHRVVGLPPACPDFAQDTRVRLQAAPATYFPCEQGRGQRVTVEYAVRPREGHYYFCYPDDYTHTHVGHDPWGKLRRTAVKPAFDVVFVAQPWQGIVDLFAPGPKTVRAALADLFCHAVLNAYPPPERPPYQLDLLLDRRVPVPAGGGDGVTAVRVKKLRVALPRTGRRVILEGDAGGATTDVYDLLDDVLPPARFPRDALHVTQAGVALTYRPADGGRDKTLAFDVTYPDGCSPKNEADDRRDLGEAYLRAWGVAGG